MSPIQNLQCVVTDLDGTLLMKNGQLSDENRQAILTLKAKGIRFAIATGRPYFSVKPLLALWQLEGLVDVIIANNGLEIVVQPDGPTYLGERMKREWVLDIVQTYRHLPGHFCFYYGDKLVGEVMDDFMTRVSTKNHLEAQVVDIATFLKTDIEKLLMAVDPEDIDTIDDFFKASGETRFRGFKSQNYLYEFMHPSINKMEGVRRYCDHVGIAADQVVAFGDNLNDLEMIEGCGFGYVMVNGDEVVKASADAIAPHHDEHGFGQMVQSWF